MPDKRITPSIGAASFSCPHCGAIAHQSWYQCHAQKYEDGNSPDIIHDNDITERLKNVPKDMQAGMRDYLQKLANGTVYAYRLSEGAWVYYHLANVNISHCFSCNQYALWIHDKIVWPFTTLEAPEAHSDLPENIRGDYEEAAQVLNISPRSTAALLRLAIQKLCRHLGEEGKDLNGDIGRLVAKGLNDQVQHALDIVRVVGNEAVHSGQIDLKDDRATALELFYLVNLIVDEMIGRPNRLNEMYEKLPPEKRQQIAQRDKRIS